MEHGTRQHSRVTCMRRDRRVPRPEDPDEPVEALEVAAAPPGDPPERPTGPPVKEPPDPRPRPPIELAEKEESPPVEEPPAEVVLPSDAANRRLGPCRRRVTTRGLGTRPLAPREPLLLRP